MICYNLLSPQLNYFIISPTDPNRIQLFKSSPQENILQRRWFNTDLKNAAFSCLGSKGKRQSKRRVFANIVRSPLVLLWTSDSQFREKEMEYWKLDFLGRIKWQNQIPHLPSTVLVKPAMQDMTFNLWTYLVLGLCSEILSKGGNDNRQLWTRTREPGGLSQAICSPRRYYDHLSLAVAFSCQGELAWSGDPQVIFLYLIMEPDWGLLGDLHALGYEPPREHKYEIRFPLNLLV